VKEYAKAAAVDERDWARFSERSPVVTDAPKIFRTATFLGCYAFREITTCERFSAHDRQRKRTASREPVGVEDGIAGRDYASLVRGEVTGPIKKRLEEDVLAAAVRAERCRVFVPAPG